MSILVGAHFISHQENTPASLPMVKRLSIPSVGKCGEQGDSSSTSEVSVSQLSQHFRKFYSTICLS
jgi:hypothetical protein